MKFFLFFLFFLFFGLTFLLSAFISERSEMNIMGIFNEFMPFLVENFFFYVFLLLIFGYVVGSVPFGVLVGHFCKVNLRAHGSGNMGTTNAFRVLGKMAGMLVFLLDFLKGYLFCFVVSFFFYQKIFPQANYDEKVWVFTIPIFYYVCLAPFFGHIFSIFQKFNGGKGIATLFGIVFFLNFFLAVYLVFIFLSLFLITRTVSFCSLFTVQLYPLIHFMCLTHYDPKKIDNGFITDIFMTFSRYKGHRVSEAPFLTTLIIVFCVIIVFYRHKENIVRMIKGEEFSFSLKKASKKIKKN